jgi:DNA polymerase III sliding clamp (beta) subunit (PCNA family)
MIIPLHKKELKAALCCISNNPTRETLNHVLLEVRKGKMPLLVSTDGAVASIIECESSAGEEDFLSVLPRQFIKTIIEAKGSSSIELRINNGVANFFNGSIEFSCNLIEGSKFPKWRKIVPAESEDKSCNQISVSVELISKVCQVVKILTPGKN